jgi:heme-degrading monooxygenase HmoA
MIAIARFETPLGESTKFKDDLELALTALSDCIGYIGGEVGQNLDEPTLWVLMTKWENVGSYRRALSSTRSKLEAIPVLARAIDEPGAYE